MLCPDYGCVFFASPVAGGWLTPERGPPCASYLSIYYYFSFPPRNQKARMHCCRLSFLGNSPWNRALCIRIWPGEVWGLTPVQEEGRRDGQRKTQPPNWLQLVLIPPEPWGGDGPLSCSGLRQPQCLPLGVHCTWGGAMNLGKAEQFPEGTRLRSGS